MEQSQMITYDKSKVAGWIVEQLSLGHLQCFFPVSFCETDAQLSSAYQTEGYLQLLRMESLSTAEAFRGLTQIMEHMLDNEKHYLFPERYRIDSNSVYFNLKKSRVKLVFLPSEGALAGAEQVISLIKYLKKKVPTEGQPYLEDLSTFLREGNTSYRSMIGRCQMLLHEIQVCDIP